MRLVALFCCSVLFAAPTFANEGTDYTGLWKGNCSDGFGVQIKPAADRLYSVSFCGPGGGFEPGEWTPNTRIEGDSKYRVVSPREMRIKRGEGGEYFTYLKCTNDPTWIVEAPAPLEAAPEVLDCSLRAHSDEDGVLIAWVTDIRITTQFGQGMRHPQKTTVGPFRPIALLKESSLQPTPGAGIHRGQSFWRALEPKRTPLKLRAVNSFLDHMNEDHCVYFGSLGKASPSRWTLLSSAPLPGVFHAPTRKDRRRFYQLNKACEIQGDYPDDRTPPCVRLRLLAISDINENGHVEYWATEPYRWDTGLTVWEEDNGRLVPLLQVCVGCSD